MTTSDFQQKSNFDVSSNNSYVAGTPYLTGGGDWKPKNIINAISEVQQFYVIESKGQNIPVEFLTLEGTIGFFKMGLRSGFGETVFIFFLFPVFEFYLIPFVFHSTGLGAVLIGAVPFILLMANTGLCFYVSRFYIGTLTRRAINSLFFGRAFILCIKSFLMYVLYSCASNPRLASPERLWSLALRCFNNQETAKNFYYGALKILPYVVPVTMVCSISMLLSAFLPYGSAYLLDCRRQRKKEKNQARVAGH
jgi:hypothetical protein